MPPGFPEFLPLTNIVADMQTATALEENGQPLKIYFNGPTDQLKAMIAGNLLLEQSRREVLDSQLDHRELSTSLRRLSEQSLCLSRPQRFTPLAFPLWADRLQTQTLSTESWQKRVEREARRLERQAQ